MWLSEAFDHFMMDVIQAWDFSVFEERYGISKVLDGERCQYGFTAVGFEYRLFVAYLAVLVRLPFSRSWWAIASGVIFGELICFMSTPFIFESVCHPFLTVIVSSHFCFLVSLMWSFRLEPALIVSSLKGSASYSSWKCFRSSPDSGVMPDMYLVRQGCICGRTHELGI